MASILPKILFLIPSLVGGGAERTLINLLQKIDYTKYEVDLVVVCYVGVYIEHLPKEVNVIPLFSNDLLVRVLAFLQKKTGFQWLFKKIMQAKVKKKYNVAISFIDSNFTDLLFFINAGRRVSWVHSSYASYVNFAKFYTNENYRKKLIEQRYGKLDSIAFVSEDAKLEFISIFGKYASMPVIYNIVDAESVKRKATEVIPEVNRPDTYFVAVGSLLPVKGFDRLVRACKILKDQGLKFHLDILGKGPLEEEMKQLIADCGVGEEVKLLGFQSNPYVYVQKCDIFVMSSVSEALPTVLCEAMILGKPTLVTNCSGCRGLVDGGVYGLMTEQDDDALAEGMKDYITKPELRTHFIEKSKERAGLFNDQHILKIYYQLFDGKI